MEIPSGSPLLEGQGWPRFPERGRRPALTMRMSHYYLSLLVLSLIGLVATAFAGVMGSPMHLTIALPTAMLVVGMHSMVILFVLIGSRLLREGTNNCGLTPEFLQESNTYFRKVSGLFLTVGGAFSIVAAAVLGYGNRAFGFPPEVHLLAGLAAAMITIVAIPHELKALHRVEKLLDMTRETLDASDAERAAQGLGPVDEEHVPYQDPPGHAGLVIAIAPWCVYLYQALIVWQGHFDRVSLHPWIEISAVGFWLWIRGRRRQPSSPQG